MNMKKLLFVLMAAFVQPQLAGAELLTGNDLYGLCSSRHVPTSQSACNFYTFGVLDGITLGTYSAERRNGDQDELIKLSDVDRLSGFCIPNEIARAQATDIFARYLEENPHERHHTAERLVLNAMREAFPCTETAD